MMRRYVYLWLTCRDRNKPSGRSWARQLGISHTWLQKLVREFREHPQETQREMGRYGDPTLAQLNRARECALRMKDRGELRLSRSELQLLRREKWAKFPEALPRVRCIELDASLRLP